MNPIKMNRLDLLDIVRANKEKHVQEYNESVNDYKAAVLRIATTNVKAAKTGDLTEISKMKAVPPPPLSYEESYKRSIRMLELSIDEFIEVDEDVFNQLVLDEWAWKRSFAVSSSMYKTIA